MRVRSEIAAATLLYGIALGTVTALPASARAEDAARSPELLAAVYACADQTEAAARLACFDAAVAAVKSAEAAGAFKAIDSAQAEIIERESFGFALPSLARLGLPSGENGDEPTSRVASTIQSVGSLGGQPTYLLENGQKWLVIGTDRNRFAKTGAEASVRKAAFGSFLMSFGNGAALRVRRLE